MKALRSSIPSENYLQFNYTHLLNVNSEKIKDNDYLLPCPFCGDTELEIIESQFEDTEDGDGLTVYCDCGAQGPAARTEDEAILKWNSRFKS